MSNSLRRDLGIIDATALVISNMIGSGIFTTTGFLAGDLGRPSLIMAVWLAGSIVAIAGCLVYAEMGVNFPRSGGEYVYLREAWGQGWGFLSGWVSFFAGFSAPIAASGLAFAAYSSYFFPSLAPNAAGSRTGPDFRWLHLGDGQLLAVAVIACFALINILGLSLAANLQNLLTGIKLAVLAAFVGLAFLVGKGAWHHFGQAIAPSSSAPLALQFGVSLTFVMFAYSGWNAATYVAEEIRTPERTLPIALAGGTLVVTAIYVACNLVFIYALPVGNLKGVLAVGAVTARELFQARGAAIFNGMMAAALLSCISAMVIVGPRVYYAMAQDGYFFRSAGRVHAERQTPVFAILFQSLAACIMVITGTFEALVYYIGFTLVLFAALTTAGIFRLRKRNGWRKISAVSHAYPLIPVLFLVTSCGMLAATIELRPKESFLGFLTMICGGALYWWRFRKIEKEI